jgi:hypothetical protein
MTSILSRRIGFHLSLHPRGRGGVGISVGLPNAHTVGRGEVEFLRVGHRMPRTMRRDYALWRPRNLSGARVSVITCSRRSASLVFDTQLCAKPRKNCWSPVKPFRTGAGLPPREAR